MSSTILPEEFTNEEEGKEKQFHTIDEVETSIEDGEVRASSEADFESPFLPVSSSCLC